MSKPAARLGDFHACPQLTPGGTPHVGGPLVQGEPRVLIGGMPAAVVGSTCLCAGPPDAVVAGSSSVLLGGRPAARQGDSTAHGGVIAAGLPTVLIGG
ncbi:PAAR domain-containing protein [Rhabdobacter roseus]|uniref:Putative Zn-binding protein involved in type VI secretion n=1 Tax=Rhabdobacter roseus TaxID=1655419 RepID=A0A840TLT1_9BACT|nr:PAAR domain-containing protein [Rhabdobacter roseus]MBB5282193.1 putative Zn-binding protein involved in type VI secretion [Rhabdobacter roseus]